MSEVYDVMSLLWEFGDGNIFIVVNLSYVYGEMGDYWVKVMVFNLFMGCFECLDSILICICDLSVSFNMLL